MGGLCEEVLQRECRGYGDGFEECYSYEYRCVGGAPDKALVVGDAGESEGAGVDSEGGGKWGGLDG